MVEQQSNAAISSELGQRHALAPDEAWRQLAWLADALRELHGRGRLHGAVFRSCMSLRDHVLPQLGPPADAVDLQGGAIDVCPPELQGQPLRKLPTDLAAARKELTGLGIAADPRRVDVYQLGSLVCHLAGQMHVSDYLRSARARGRLPPRLRPLVDRALGYDPGNRFADCQQLAAAMQAAEAMGRSAESDTPASGIPAESPLDIPLGGHGPAADASEVSVAPLPEQLGAYRILQPIGHGGMGDVFKAFDPALDRVVAVKVLPPELARQPDFVRRFRAEAAAVAKLVHPNIVQIYAFGEEAGRHYFSMQFVEGESLAQLLARQDRLSVEETLPIVGQCLAGLAAAHRRGLIHRDIKPGNILLDREHCRALVADFGLVKTIAGGETLTATGVVMGTVDYLSPEQARGLKIDTRSDLYSVGALLYRMLSGRLPFVADSATGMIFQHAFEQPTPLAELAPEIPRGLSSIVMRLLEKEPSNRYQSAEEVTAAIEAFEAGSPAAESQASSEAASSNDVVAGWPDMAVPGSAAVGRPGWKAKFWHLFHAHAPAAVKDLLATEQQFDGAVADYERRRDALAQLVEQAAEVVVAFEAQARQHREAAAGAAEAEQAELEHAAANLHEQSVDARRQLQDLQSQLSNVDATLGRLRSQRDALRLRLAAAQAELSPAGLSTRRQPGRRALLTAAALLATLCLACTLLLTLISAPPLPPPALVVELPEPAAPVAAVAPLAIYSERAAAEAIIRLGGSVKVLADGQRLHAFDHRTGSQSSDQITELQFFPSGPFTIEWVDIHRQLSAPNALHALAGLHDLEGVNLWASAVTDAALEQMGPQPKLRTLALDDTKITDQAMTYVASLTALEDLRLDGQPITDAGIAQLRPLMNLRKLSLGGTAITDAGLSHSGVFKELEQLSLHDTRISGVGLAALVQLPSLISLNLDRVTLSKAGYDALSELPLLRSLSLTGANVTDERLPDLAKLRHLGSLDLEHTQVTDVGLALLEPLVGLESLNLGRMPITDRGLLEVGRLGQLWRLAVPDTNITPAGVGAFAFVLPHCKVEGPAPRPLPGDPAITLDADGWLRLTPLVQLLRDTKDAGWTLAGDTAELTAGRYRAYASVPVVISGSYELRARISLSRASGSTLVWLPVGGEHAAVLELKGDQGSADAKAASVRLRGLSPEPAPSGTSMISVGQDHEYRCQVQIAGEQATLDVQGDGQALFHWTGPLASIETKTIRPGTVGLETRTYSIVQFKDLRLKALDVPPGAEVSPLSATTDTLPLGGRGGGWFRELSPGGVPISGFEVTSFSYGGHIAVRSLRALYLGPDGYGRGQTYGHPSGKPKTVVAKDGYAVGGIVARVGDRFNGFKIVFMRRQGNILNANDSYESPWLGGPGGDAPMPLGCDGRPIIGIVGRSGMEIDALGLVRATHGAKR